MSKNKDFENVSSQIVDMIVGSTLKKHGVKLDPQKIDSKEKEELRRIVNNLQESVDAFTKKKDKDKKE
ncbi:hypothetical protein MUO14_20970 [Halobacillus shinanisalinarum]|uniref:Spore coat protein W n=1 Tax=Halobacillus shinanisalinarum TaxID=2932258 RepID=A0ABY4GY71_9BACI|nr:hypothetical protein [Halobacillus shinanisalinarum]UOQ92853.1 hypothetical protein MUO14_20970 [Halobacillus shinanisalinarum]